MEKSKTALITASIVMPAVTPEQALDVWQKYQDLKSKIVEESDIQLIDGKKFLKKSYWRKVATFFNLTTEVVEERRESLGKTFAWHFTVKATAPNRRSAIGVGSCDAFEKASLRDGKYMKKGRVTKWGRTTAGKSYPEEFEWIDAIPNSIHNIRSTAETRAVNRAISNLVGGGEVSAEEVEEPNGNGHAAPVVGRKAATGNGTAEVGGNGTRNGKCHFCGTAGKYHKKGCPEATDSPVSHARHVEPTQETTVVPDDGGDPEVPAEDIPF